MAARPDPAISAPPRPTGPVGGPAAWRGADLAGSDEWIFRLDGDDVAELEQALRAARASGIPLADLDRNAFPLPRLGARLAALRGELLHGRGFALLRGLPIERYPIADAATIYLGLGAHLGHPVSQNGQGHLLGHIIDVGRAEDDPSARIYQTNARQFYHADSCDIVGLLCLHKARRGGASTIVSSTTLHDELLAQAPELLDELFRPFHVDRRGEVPPGCEPWYEVPVFSWTDGFLAGYYVRRYIESARRFDRVPPLTARQIAAFDALDALAEREDLHLSMAFEPGDMQLLHNLQIFHDRTAFEDWPEPHRRRHLLRLWLCPPDGRPLAPAFAQRWGSVEPGRRGGIVVAGQTLVAPLEP